jgi:phage terminase large subunit
MIDISPDLTTKQKKAFKYLIDDSTTEVLYGGAAGGGKSYLLCCYAIITCLQYPGVRGLIGRSKLDALKKTTLNTFFDVCNQWNIKAGEHYNYNAQSNIITFYNDSQIILKDLFLYPSDANFDSLGSLELTFACIDEANQITEKAKNVLSSRLRYRLDEYNLIPKLYMSCNPAKGWVYNIYKESRDNTLPNHKKFIQALVSDNKHISKHYEEQLMKLDEISKARLLRGDWEYDDSNDTLIEYDAIINMFSNIVDTGEKYITADIARYGKDKTCIMYWNGLQVSKIIVLDKSSMVDVANKIKEIQQIEGVRLSNIIVDEDGVGGGAKDILRCKGFINNSKAIRGENYQNLKTQCYYKLADLINKGRIGVSTNDIKFKELLIQELEMVKRTNIDKDSKLSILSKDKVKDLIGRSPDYSDALMMRMYYELGMSTGKYAVR